MHKHMRAPTADCTAPACVGAGCAASSHLTHDENMKAPAGSTASLRCFTLLMLASSFRGPSSRQLTCCSAVGDCAFPAAWATPTAPPPAGVVALLSPPSGAPSITTSEGCCSGGVPRRLCRCLFLSTPTLLGPNKPLIVWRAPLPADFNGGEKSLPHSAGTCWCWKTGLNDRADSNTKAEAINRKAIFHLAATNIRTRHCCC